VEPEPAPGVVRVAANEITDRHPFDLVGEALSETQMKPTDRIRIRCCRVGERTIGQDVLNPCSMPPHLGVETTPGNGVPQRINGIPARPAGLHLEFAPCSSAGTRTARPAPRPA